MRRYITLVGRWIPEEFRYTRKTARVASPLLSNVVRSRRAVHRRCCVHVDQLSYRSRVWRVFQKEVKTVYCTEFFRGLSGIQGAPQSSSGWWGAFNRGPRI